MSLQTMLKYNYSLSVSNLDPKVKFPSDLFELLGSKIHFLSKFSYLKHFGDFLLWLRGNKPD